MSTTMTMTAPLKQSRLDEEDNEDESSVRRLARASHWVFSFSLLAGQNTSAGPFSQRRPLLASWVATNCNPAISSSTIIG